VRSERTVEPGGFVERMVGVKGARVRIVHLHGHGLNFELLEYLEPRGDQRAREPNHVGAAHLCFLTDDIEQLCDELTSKRVRIRSENGRPVRIVGGPNDGGKGLYLEDPDGNCVEVHQWVQPRSEVP
jgi:catechol 2,3-dioxygenase-like lactoylglutathione lyase family enzyme